MTSTRGERNNNPGNLRHGEPWRGLADRQPDADFCTFIDPKYGFRAMAKTLLSYNHEGYDTVREIVTRWAPASENNTAAYISAVAGHMACDPDTHLDVSDYTQMYPLVDAITRHENGRNRYGRDIVDAGLALAGVEA